MTSTRAGSTKRRSVKNADADKTIEAVSNSTDTTYKHDARITPFPLPLNVLFIVSALAPPYLLCHYYMKQQLPTMIYSLIYMCAASYALCIQLIPSFSIYLKNANLIGRDINKASKAALADTSANVKTIPEALGVVSSVICVLTLIVFQTVFFKMSDSKSIEIFHSILICLNFTILLGFADDVLNLPWRYKIVLPTVASLPLLLSYTGGTSIIIPNLFHFVLPRILNLQWFYYLYMNLLSVFCTNSINIYAGINGLEAGQSIVIAIFVLIHNVIEYTWFSNATHIYSMIVILPFIATTLGLLYYNKYPSSVFVGDTFCYFAGMIFACAGITGHFSKTLLLFFIPQIINFLYSLPQILQIFGLTCPRHRLPKYNEKTGKLESIHTHNNLINAWLWIVGPTSEKMLWLHLMVLQVACCCVGLFIRYQVAGYFYN